MRNTCPQHETLAHLCVYPLTNEGEKVENKDPNNIEPSRSIHTRQTHTHTPVTDHKNERTYLKMPEKNKGC